MTPDRRPIPNDDPTPDLLDRATAALRAVPVPGGPPPETVAGTLSALKTVAGTVSPEPAPQAGRG